MFRKNKDFFLWILLGVYILFTFVVGQVVNSLNSRMGGIVLISPIVLMLFYYIIIHGGIIRLSKKLIILYLLVFSSFCLLSGFWAQSRALAVSKGVDILETTVIMVVITICIPKNKTVDCFLMTIMFSSYAVMIFEIMYYGLDYYINSLKNSTRIGSEMINSNTLGLCIAFAIIINFYFIIYRKIGIWTVFFIATGFVILASSGSRKALVAVVLGVFLLLLLKIQDKNFIISSIKTLFFLLVISIVGYYFLKLPMFNMIMERMRGILGLIKQGYMLEKSARIRQTMIEVGLSLFKNHVFWGVGIDNPRLYMGSVLGDEMYLHNNFIELLAGGGLVGFMAYYWIYVLLLFIYAKCRCVGNPQFDVCLTLLIVNILMNYGMVTYYSKITYIFLLLFCIEADELKRGEGWETA